jgi:hypothetical protein
MIRALLLLLATSLAASGCARNGPGTSTAGSQAADTLRGIVRIVGAEPATSITIDAGAGGTVVVTGERSVLEQLSGIEVTVWGERQSQDRFSAARVAVRAVAGVTAVEGVLQRDGDRYVLVTADGLRLPVPHLPEELRSRVGVRMWVAGPLDRPPDAYGVIR